MTVSTTATVDVTTPDLRAALDAVLPHANRLKTDDHQAEHRVRLSFNGWTLFVMASNGQSIALATIDVLEDSRIEASETQELPKDDGPMVFDLQPRQVKNILQQFKAKPSDPDSGQQIRFTLDTVAGTIELQDVGGLYSAGERMVLPVGEPSSSFPNVLLDVSRAVAAIGESPTAKPLVQNGKILALFTKASTAYKADAQIRATGSATSPGFVITVGPDFIGLVASHFGGDEDTRKWQSTLNNWLELLPDFKLAVA